MEQERLLCDVVNVILTVISLGFIGWFVFAYRKRKSKIRRVHYLFVLASFVVIFLCGRAMYGNYERWDIYNKVVRPPQSSYLDELHLSPQECVDDFGEVVDIVNHYYKEMAIHKRIDLGKLNAEYGGKVAEVDCAQQYGLLLLQYFGTLRNMHTFPYFSERLSFTSLVSRNDSVWIWQCYDDAVDLKTMDLVVAVNGVPTKDYIKEQIRLVCTSTDAYRRRLAAKRVLHSYTDTCQQLTIQRGDSILEVSVPLYTEEKIQEKVRLQAFKDSVMLASQPVRERMMSVFVDAFEGLENVGYISVPHFESGSVEDFCWWAKREFGNDYLILDLQNNLGGMRGNVLKIASYLIPQTTTVGKIVIESDTARCYRGKLFVLMNENTSSGAELLVALLKGKPGVVVVGRRSAGDCGSRGYNFRTSHGIEFKLATEAPYLLPDGTTWSEGEGILPDIEVEEYLPWEEGKDMVSTVLDFIREEERRLNEKL